MNLLVSEQHSPEERRAITGALSNIQARVGPLEDRLLGWARDIRADLPRHPDVIGRYACETLRDISPDPMERARAEDLLARLDRAGNEST